MPLFGRLCRRREEQNYHPHAVRFEQDILPHLKTTVFITGAFCTAWAWDLVYYGGSHAAAGENPLRQQLGFASNARAPSHVWILLVQYLIVCAGAAVLSDAAERQHAVWSKAAVTAIEFFPSPVFAGKLMGYLTTFTQLDTVESALVNLGATWFAATLAHVTPMIFTAMRSEHRILMEQWRLQKFSRIVQDTLGFGLGIAWNVFLGNLLGPQQQQQQQQDGDENDLDLFRLVGLGGYLAVVTLISFRLAATVPQNTTSDTTTIMDRQWILLEFASYVVNAFTLVTFLNALLRNGWIGHLEGLWVLWVLSAGMSALVARADLEGTATESSSSASFSVPNDNHSTHCELQEGPFSVIFCLLLFVPCVWCCCPWVPVLWLLAGTTEASLLGVKEHWYKLIAMVAGLASSIEASGMVTDATDWLASPFCTVKHCSSPWLFMVLQTSIAAVVTIVLVPAISLLASDNYAAADVASLSTQPAADTIATKASSQKGMGEKKPLLKKVRDKFRKDGSESYEV